MNKFFFILLFFSLGVSASPEEDLDAFRSHFKSRFPSIGFSDYKNGVYSVDPSSREQWESIEEFPPYEINIEQGEELFNTPFKKILRKTIKK